MSKPSAGGRCVGGKFHSTGTKGQMADNLALVTRLVGEIGSDGRALVEPKDLPFFDDTLYKLQRSGSAGGMFGWKQVEAMVRIHKYVGEVRSANSK